MDLFSPEQLKAADVAPGQDDDWIPRIHPDDSRRGEVHVDVDLARGQGLLSPDGPFFLDVLYISESLTLQELFGHVLGTQTDGGDLVQPERCRLRRRLRADGSAVQSNEPCRPHQGQPLQELPPAPAFSLLPMHGTSPFLKEHGRCSLSES